MRARVVGYNSVVVLFTLHYKGMQTIRITEQTDVVIVRSLSGEPKSPL